MERSKVKDTFICSKCGYEVTKKELVETMETKVIDNVLLLILHCPKCGNTE